MSRTVWEWMKDQLAKVKQFLGIIPKKVREFNSRSLTITTNIKKVLDNPAIDIVTTIIPGTWDDKAVSIFREYLAKALPYLHIVDVCKDHQELDDMLQCWVTELRKLPQHTQNAILHKLAALLTAYQDNESLRMRLYDLYVQMDYIEHKEAAKG